MRLLLQRVKAAAVHVDGAPVASIGTGLLVLVGFGAEDAADLPRQPVWNAMLRKMLSLRIFPDAQGKMNRTLEEYSDGTPSDVSSHRLLLVPQFTLYADCGRGRRPSFQNAAPPARASVLFAQCARFCETALPHATCTGIFGADMDVSLTNWGPVTILLDSRDFL
ncbi:MAG: D-tyrosyl-tRNA(Tyr) deacylase [Desulfovibrionaceae bacterium]|nr:D-tyrosyl-tRNA(Tyr) deacylase [Desulfovibrionaceae bacterium]